MSVDRPRTTQDRHGAGQLALGLGEGDAARSVQYVGVDLLAPVGGKVVHDHRRAVRVEQRGGELERRERGSPVGVGLARAGGLPARRVHDVRVDRDVVHVVTLHDGRAVRRRDGFGRREYRGEYPVAGGCAQLQVYVREPGKAVYECHGVLLPSPT